jgi:hypothetical protein
MTKSAPDFESKCGGRGGGCGCGVSANEYSCAHGAQINFVDLILYLTYVYNYQKLIVTSFNLYQGRMWPWAWVVGEAGYNIYPDKS